MRALFTRAVICGLTLMAVIATAQAQQQVLYSTAQVSAPAGVTFADALTSIGDTTYVVGRGTDLKARLYVVTAPYTAATLVAGFAAPGAPEVLSAPKVFKGSTYFLGSKGETGISLYAVNTAGVISEIKEFAGVARAQLADYPTRSGIELSTERLWVLLNLGNLGSGYKYLLYGSDGSSAGTHQVEQSAVSYPIAVTANGVYYRASAFCKLEFGGGYYSVLHFYDGLAAPIRIQYPNAYDSAGCLGIDWPNYPIGEALLARNSAGWFMLNRATVRLLSRDTSYLVPSDNLLRDADNLLFDSSFDGVVRVLRIAKDSDGTPMVQFQSTLNALLNPTDLYPMKVKSNQDYFRKLRMIDGQLYLLDTATGAIYEQVTLATMRWVTPISGYKTARFRYLSLMLTQPMALRVQNSIFYVATNGTLQRAVAGPDLCAGSTGDKVQPGTCGCWAEDIDTDRDGTVDCLDGCKNDPAKTQPGVCSCGTPDIDTDKDGTFDCKDGCKNDSAKTQPGVCDCGTPDVDTDKDGTFDCKDSCKNDPAKTQPGVCGCGVKDVDTDKDGTMDCRDLCPNDPLKTAPGLCNCGVSDFDADKDGVVDCRDQCAYDPQKTTPGLCGCGVSDIDTDKDGTPDCTDQCKIDPLKKVSGTCGCGVPDKDSDGDGTLDCVDPCPSDPAKKSAQQCGCGVPETDTDQDGIPDCNDGCPSDRLKAAEGTCGCNKADVDTDGDGFADCIDGCPADSRKSQAGSCGCGVSEVDTDGDGSPDCNDLCPTSISKTAPGVCGCGIPDTDLNRNGIVDCTEAAVTADSDRVTWSRIKRTLRVTVATKRTEPATYQLGVLNLRRGRLRTVPLRVGSTTVKLDPGSYALQYRVRETPQSSWGIWRSLRKVTIK